MMTNKQWENNLPKSVIQEAGFGPDENHILSRPFQHKTLEERIRESGSELTGIGEIDWGNPQGNEIW